MDKHDVDLFFKNQKNIPENNVRACMILDLYRLWIKEPFVGICDIWYLFVY